MKNIISAGILLLASLIAALIGLGLAYHSFVTPLSSKGTFNKIGGDKWIEEGSEITLSKLLHRGNKAKLSFNTWRPEGLEAAHLKVFLCDNLISDFRVSEQPQVLYLTNTCNPKILRFEVVNPFTPSELDQRKLGAQLETMQIYSDLGVPLVDLRLLIQTALAIFILSFLWLLIANQIGSRVLPFLAPIFSCLVLYNCENLNLQPAQALWIVITFVSFGFYLYGRLQDNRSGFELNNSSNILSSMTIVPEGQFLWSSAIIVSILVVGALLRFYNIDFGLPFNYHPDEVPKFNAIQRMRAHGDLNPRYFLHPSMLLYGTYFANSLLHLFGRTGEWMDSAIYAGRLMSATAGTLSIYLTYTISKRLFSTHTGLLSAAALALFPLHITCSRYVKEDALLLFMILLTIHFVVKAVKQDKAALLLIAGLLAGASAATKYSGILVFAVIIGAPFLKSRHVLKPDLRFLKFALFASLLIPVGFVICTPYSVLDSATFLKDVASETEHMARGHTILIDPWSQFWTYHLARSILPGVTIAPYLLALIGFGLLIRRRRIEDLFVISLFLLFYLPAEYVNAKPAPQPERYIFPCLPFIAIAASELIHVLRKKSLHALASIGIFLLLISPVKRSLNLASELKPDTRDLMRSWMLDNVPQGSTILVDWKPYNPVFSEEEFTLVYLPRDDILSNLRMSKLRESKADFLLLSGLFYDRYFNQPNANPAFREIIRDVRGNFTTLKEFKPKYGTYGFHNPSLTLFDLKN
ncbi:MAG: glycosyltransferase family 39 protein [Deltaproteobacteria bacterium]|nr:glycosyltransferase family 39 protein [Deltaproteobacteria bacterium]